MVKTGFKQITNLMGKKTGDVAFTVSTRPSRTIDFKGIKYRIDISGERIADIFSRRALHKIRYNYAVKAKRGGENIKKQFRLVRGRKTSRYNYVAGIVLNSSARRWFQFLENIRWRPHWIPIEFIEQHEESPGKRGRYVDDPKYFVKVTQNKRLLGLTNDAINKTAKNFNKYLVKELKKEAKI